MESVAAVAPKTGSEAAVFENGRALGLTENSIQVLTSRYLKKDAKGNLTETPEELFRRVAHTIAVAEVKYGKTAEQVQKIEDQYFDMMVKGIFMPNSPTLMNAGREMGMLSACFVLPIEDSIEGIFDTVKATAMIQKAGGGTGFCFDRLRPTGDYIKSSGGTTSGPISFWKVLSEATNAIQQGAFRRGANMGMMRIDHPDILKFINAKQDLARFQNYNISVKVTDNWMASYEAEPDSPNIVTNFRKGLNYVIPKSVNVMTYEVKDLIPLEEYTASKTKREVWTRRDIWDTIINNAWKTGEPGVVFIDRVNQFNPTPNVGPMEATNPCGEQPLLPFEACNLGSVNLGLFVHPHAKGGADVDWDGLGDAVRLSTRFLENVVEVNNYVIPEIHKICTENRKIGLGIMGFADALFKLGVGYNTDAGVEWGSHFMKFVNDEAHNESERLAEERGVFANWKGSRWETQWKRKQRNACSTTVAPTGTISIISNCSGGVEPLFSLAFERRVLKDSAGVAKVMIEVNDVFMDVATKANFWNWNKDDLLKRILKEGTIHNIDAIPADVKAVFACAHDITPEWHIKMQAAFQKHCDSAISKTTNFPNSATPDDVRKIYTEAFRSGCKGVTVYRDGCRAEQPMALKEKEVKKEGPIVLKPAKTPTILSAVRIRQRTAFGNMHLSITVDPKTEREMEVFAQIGKAGDVTAGDSEAICRMISLFLRSGGTMDLIIDQLEGIGSHMSIGTKEGRVMSLGDALAKTIKRYMIAKERFGLKAILLGDIDINALPEEKTQTDVRSNLIESLKLKCPECNVGTLVLMEGCQKCPGCGYSKC